MIDANGEAPDFEKDYAAFIKKHAKEIEVPVEEQKVKPDPVG